MDDATREALRRNGDPWPHTTRVDPARDARLHNLSHLSAAAKRKAWLWLQAERPALAELLASPGVRRLIETFDAQVRIDLNGQPLPAEVTQCS